MQHDEHFLSSMLLFACPYCSMHMGLRRERTRLFFFESKMFVEMLYLGRGRNEFYLKSSLFFNLKDS